MSYSRLLCRGPACKVTKIHVKVDTGMGRIGVLPEEVVSFVREISKLESM